jgi:hypothetical protein
MFATEAGGNSWVLFVSAERLKATREWKRTPKVPGLEIPGSARGPIMAED